MMFNALAKAMSMRGLGSLAGIGVSLLLLAWLTSAELGLFFMVEGAATLVGLVASLSVPAATTPLLVRRDLDPAAQAAMSGALLFMAASQTAILLALGLLALLLAPLIGRDVGMVWFAIVILAPINCLRLFLIEYHRIKHRFFLAAALQDKKGRSLVLVGFLAVMMVADIPAETRLWLAMLALMIAAFIPVLIATLLTPWRELGAPETFQALKIHRREIVAMIIKLAPHDIMVRGFPQMLVVLTGSLAGPPAAAAYGLARSVVGAGEIFTVATRLTFVRAVQRYFAGNSKGLNQDFVLCILLASGGTLLVIAAYFAIGKPLLVTLFPIENLPAVLMTISILFGAAWIRSATNFAEIFLKNIGTVWVLHVSYAISIAAMIALSLLLLPILGAPAAALALLGQQAFVGLVTSVYVYNVHGVPDFAKADVPKLMGRAWGRLKRR